MIFMINKYCYLFTIFVSLGEEFDGRETTYTIPKTEHRCKIIQTTKEQIIKA
jgi:hypothetical protein